VASQEGLSPIQLLSVTSRYISGSETESLRNQHLITVYAVWKFPIIMTKV
jgi:hypothetical protein